MEIENRGFEVRVATGDEQEAVVNIRRTAYEELIEKSGGVDLITDSFDGSPCCRSYLLIAPNGELAGTIRPCVRTSHFDWPSLPLSNFSPEEMNRIIESGAPLVQSTMFGVVPRYRGLGLFVTLALLRAVCGVAQAFDADQLVTVIDSRRAKIGFWARFGWETVGGAIPHPYTRDGAVILRGSISETLRIASQRQEFHELNRFASDARGSGAFPNII